MPTAFHLVRTGLFGLCLSFGLAATSPGVAQTNEFSVPMPKEPYTIEIPFKPYGSMLYAITIREVQGKVAVCGMWTKGKRWQAYVKKAHLPMRVRGVTKVLLGDTYLLTGVGFFNEVSEEEFAVGTRANCQMTGVTWQHGYSHDLIRLRIPRLRVVA